MLDFAKKMAIKAIQKQAAPFLTAHCPASLQPRLAELLADEQAIASLLSYLYDVGAGNKSFSLKELDFLPRSSGSNSELLNYVVPSLVSKLPIKLSPSSRFGAEIKKMLIKLLQSQAAPYLLKKCPSALQAPLAQLLSDDVALSSIMSYIYDMATGEASFSMDTLQQLPMTPATRKTLSTPGLIKHVFTAIKPLLSSLPGKLSLPVPEEVSFTPANTSEDADNDTMPQSARRTRSRATEKTTGAGVAEKSQTAAVEEDAPYSPEESTSPISSEKKRSRGAATARSSAARPIYSEEETDSADSAEEIALLPVDTPEDADNDTMPQSAHRTRSRATEKTTGAGVAEKSQTAAVEEDAPYSPEESTSPISSEKKRSRGAATARSSAARPIYSEEETDSAEEIALLPVDTPEDADNDAMPQSARRTRSRTTEKSDRSRSAGKKPTSAVEDDAPYSPEESTSSMRTEKKRSRRKASTRSSDAYSMYSDADTDTSDSVGKIALLPALVAGGLTLSGVLSTFYTLYYSICYDPLIAFSVSSILGYVVLGVGFFLGNKWVLKPYRSAKNNGNLSDGESNVEGFWESFIDLFRSREQSVSETVGGMTGTRGTTKSRTRTSLCEQGDAYRQQWLDDKSELSLTERGMCYAKALECYNRAADKGDWNAGLRYDELERLAPDSVIKISRLALVISCILIPAGLVSAVYGLCNEYYGYIVTYGVLSANEIVCAVMGVGIFIGDEWVRKPWCKRRALRRGAAMVRRTNS